MLSLVQDVPEAVECDGKEYPIRTDFRVWMEFEQILFSALPWQEKAVRMLVLCYAETLPDSLESALALLLDFYAGHPKRKSLPTEEKVRKRIYDFTEDADMIYAAFLAQYHIDLTTENLHWWKFLALFHSLSAKSKLMQVIRIRALDLSRVSGSEKNYYRRMKWLYRLPQDEMEEAVQPAMVLDGLI
ncbi:MAG: hypothetical protein IJB48_03215 [Clostridia bacterium]|nr:hypothetical protein [Clostridia bacterium]MBQ3553845.1 hypothetical protein [Clostridia bacterium]